MHATVDRAQSIIRELQYHELKVKRGKAELIGGDNFIKEVPELNYAEKLFHFNRLIALDNQGYKPVLVVFLDFGRADNLDNPTMFKATQAYAEAMGLGQQPWLAYRHRDTLHDHVHLVSTTIKADGNKIPVNRALLRHSRELTHRLEKEYGLDGNVEEAILRAKHKYLQKVEYGKVSLYPAIKLVLETIVPGYKYTNLEELNAVLGLFNVRARETSAGYERRGLLYYPVLPNGKDGRTVFKASSFPSQPTLPRLEERFAENLALREENRRRLTGTIDYALAGQTLSFDAFKQDLGRQQVSVVTPRSEAGGQRIWFVDHRTQSVFEGAVLGARYTAAMIRQRCLPDEVYQQKQQLQRQQEAERQGQRMRHSL